MKQTQRNFSWSFVANQSSRVALANPGAFHLAVHRVPPRVFQSHLLYMPDRDLIQLSA